MAVNRLPVRVTTMRRLLLLSGGICAMPECKKRLVEPSGGWIGTIAHIIAAEDDGPRADREMPPEKRRAFENLLLLCANHGRLVDDNETGERDFPVARLHEIKRAHEQRIDDLVATMRKYEARAPTAKGVIDVSHRKASASTDAAAYINYLGLNDPDIDEADQLIAKVHAELEASRHQLSRLSALALGILAALLALWEGTLVSSANSQRDVGRDVFDPGAPYVSVPYASVRNRQIKKGELASAVSELQRAGLLRERESREDEYDIMSPWSTEWCTWRTYTDYLWQAHGIAVSAWVATLDYTLFDAVSGGRAATWT